MRICGLWRLDVGRFECLCFVESVIVSIYAMQLRLGYIDEDFWLLIAKWWSIWVFRFCWIRCGVDLSYLLCFSLYWGEVRICWFYRCKMLIDLIVFIMICGWYMWNVVLLEWFRLLIRRCDLWLWNDDRFECMTDFSLFDTRSRFLMQIDLNFLWNVIRFECLSSTKIYWWGWFMIVRC